MGNKEIDRFNFLTHLYRYVDTGKLEIRELPSKRQDFYELNKLGSLKYGAKENVYFGVATRNGGGTKDHIAEIPALWCDIDFKDTPKEKAGEKIAGFPFKPTAVVESGGGYHLYYRLTEPCEKSDIREVESYLRRLALYFDGDMAATDASRILRLPGTVNHKYKPGRAVEVVRLYPDQEVDLSDLDSILPKDEPVEPNKKKEWKQTKLPFEGVDEGNRNDTITKLAGKYIYDGLSNEEIEPILLRCNESNNPPLPEKEVLNILKSVRKTDNRNNPQAPVTTSDDRKSDLVVLNDSIVNMGAFRQEKLTERKEFLTPWLKSDSINLITGWRGVGKTFFALSILDAVSRGNPFGPWACPEKTHCLFLDGEMPQQDMVERDLDLGHLNDDILIYSEARANRRGAKRAHLASVSWRTLMKEVLLQRKVKLWVVDNLASLASGLDENAKKDWDPINQWLLELRFSGISTIMLHHTNKDGGQRGTSAREDNLDTSIILKRPPSYVKEDGANFIVNFSKARVRTKDLISISDTEFKLSIDKTGKNTWVWGNVGRERKREILKMLSEGANYNEITDTLGITKAYVSKVKKRAIEDGLLSTKNELTPSGEKCVTG